MKQDPQAVELARVCRARGLPQAPEKRIAAALELAPALRAPLSTHLAAARFAIDDSTALAWLRDFTVVVQWDSGDERPQCQFDDLAQLLDLLAEQQTSEGAQERRQSHENLHVFGKSAALTVELDRLRPDKRAGELWTIAFEAAGAGTQQRSFDWTRKIVVQLGRKELPELTAVLLGLNESWSTEHHGPGHDKALTVRNQSGGLQVVVRQGNRALSVPAGAGDSYLLASLAIKALMLNDPHLTSDTVVSLCKRVARHAKVETPQ